LNQNIKTQLPAALLIPFYKITTFDTENYHTRFQIVPMKLVFATHNPNKLKEVQQMVPDHIELINLETIGCTTNIPETANTLEGNAKIKADFVTNTYQLSCFADDTGLLVETLNGEPGVYSARYAGEQNDVDANMNKLLDNLKNEQNRTAHFKTVIALNLNGKTHIFEGKIEGVITENKRGHNGFGYDPIFKPNGYDKTFAELPLSIKNNISHRAKAFKKLIDYLKTTHVTG
tara:strand:- start:841 stop:1536 length:696 start_codon:yes stop_codon:yes gene_type:complete